MILAVLAAAVLAVVTLKLRPRLVPAPVLLAAAAPGCDLRASPCTARFPDGGEVILNIVPRGIPRARPLVFEVAIRGVETSAVAVDLVGVDMNMGYNRPSLAPVGPGRYRGQGMLPVCVRERMTWEARVLLTTPRGLLAASFRFGT